MFEKKRDRLYCCSHCIDTGSTADHYMLHTADRKNKNK